MPDAFPQTRISLLEVIQAGDANDKRVALEALMRNYWRPVREYVRLKWNYADDDAEDLTQGFFTRVLTHDTFAKYDRTKARFRTFLRVCLDRYVAKAYHREQRHDTSLAGDLDLDLGNMPARDAAVDASDAMLRDAWIRHFFERVVAKLEEELTAAGKRAHFDLFTAYDLRRADEQAPPTYGALAERFSLPVTQVTNFLALARREFRRLVLDELRATSMTDADYADELRELLGDAP